MNTTTIPDTSGTLATQGSVSGRYVRAGLVAGAIAAAVTSALAIVVDQLGLRLEAQGKGFPALAFAQVSLFGAITGVALAAVFARKARRPRHTFVVATIVLTVLSFVPPLLISASVGTVLVLELMHVVAALIVIPAIATRLAE